MKIRAINEVFEFDGRDYRTLSEEEKRNIWLLCVDYLRKHYNGDLWRHLATCLPCMLGTYSKEEGFTIEI